MGRPLNLRQVEAFKAVIENGTASRAAELLRVSQPAVSKLLGHLEEDTGLKLFERVKGRLVPTRQGMRLYEEIDRIFVGVQQVERAVESIRREEQGRLLVGVMPGLSGTFIQRVTMAFRRHRPDVHVTIHVRSSQFIADWLIGRQLDVGLIRSRIDNPYVDAESFMEHPLVCILPLGHALTGKRVITPSDLHGQSFVSFSPDSYTGLQIAGMFEKCDVRANILLETNVAPTVCEFVAAGLGVSLVHPLFVDDIRHGVAVRRFQPTLPFDFQVCRARDSRNASLVEIFVEETRLAASRMSRGMTGDA